MASQKNILVIGGAGFIGAHLCERLLKDANVICIDNFVTSAEKNINHLLRLPHFEFIKHDISHAIDLEKIPDLAKFQLNVFGIQEIYYLACPMSINNFEKFRMDTVYANTTGLINALELAVKFKSKFMQFSSAVVYGEVPRGEFIRENYRGMTDMLAPNACYDEGKRYAESVVDSYHRVHSLDTKIARIFRTYGPRMLMNDGQLVPDFIMNALDNKDVVIYGGENFQTSLCYVSDVVEACLKLMESNINEPMNVGATDVYKVSDIAKKIIEMTGSSSTVKFEPPKEFLRELALPDITKIKETFGWFPIVTLEEGLQKSVDFTRAHKDLLTFSTDI